MAVIGDIDEAVVDGDELQAAPESLGRVVVSGVVANRGIQVLLPGLFGVFEEADCEINLLRECLGFTPEIASVVGIRGQVMKDDEDGKQAGSP